MFSAYRVHGLGLRVPLQPSIAGSTRAGLVLRSPRSSSMGLFDTPIHAVQGFEHRARV